MEAPEEIKAAAAATTTNNNITNSNNIVAKGKRTKRQRVQSPIPFANLTANSSSGEGEGERDRYRDGEGEGGDVAGDIDCTNENISTNIMSPTNSQEFRESTQEEEDMANCLILLAQGHKNKNNNNNNDGGLYYNPTITATTTATAKFNSRRFLETGSLGSGKAGYYVYECKTCNRTFPSFQALGGHRASHKKPKLNDQENNNKKHFTILSSDEEDGHFKDISNLSLQLSNNNSISRGIYISNKNKIHECSICGAVFNSGQALGGHMRRHRAPMGANNSHNNNNSTASLSLTTTTTPMGIESEEALPPKKARNLLSLDLDLNLPAPDDEKLAFASKQQKQEQQKPKPKPTLVFSGAALVDCHY